MLACPNTELEPKELDANVGVFCAPPNTDEFEDAAPNIEGAADWVTSVEGFPNIDGAVLTDENPPPKILWDVVDPKVLLTDPPPNILGAEVATKAFPDPKTEVVDATALEDTILSSWEVGIEKRELDDDKLGWVELVWPNKELVFCEFPNTEVEPDNNPKLGALLVTVLNNDEVLGVCPKAVLFSPNETDTDGSSVWPEESKVELLCPKSEDFVDVPNVGAEELKTVAFGRLAVVVLFVDEVSGKTSDEGGTDDESEHVVVILWFPNELTAVLDNKGKAIGPVVWLVLEISEELSWTDGTDVGVNKVFGEALDDWLNIEVFEASWPNVEVLVVGLLNTDGVVTEDEVDTEILPELPNIEGWDDGWENKDVPKFEDEIS